MRTAADLRLANLIDIDDLEHFHRLEIRHFFKIYTDLEPGKRVNAEGGSWNGQLQAQAEIERSRRRHLLTVMASQEPAARHMAQEYA
jgi:inorganic pyrophosphatase